jgi:peptidoglycan/LPS O-acetylase OafA/YrhL
MIVQEHGGIGIGQWLRFIFFAQNFSQWTIETVDGPMWSLVVELHFYVLLPFLAYGLARVARGRLRVVTGILLALGAAAFALRCATFLYADHPSREWRYSLPTLFHFFVAGMLLALLRLRWEANRPAWVRGIAASSTAWLLASVPLWLWGVENLKAEIPLALAGFLTVGAVVLPLDHGRLVRALEWRPLSLAGIASYSLYLWHVPVVLWLAGGHFTFSADGLTSGYSGDPHRFVTLLAYSLPACLLVAAVSYRLIEAPFLRLRKRWA